MSLFDLLWPPRCAACDVPSRAVFCASCALGLEAAPPLSVPGLGAIAACFRYEGPGERALFRLKYDRELSVGARLASLVAGAAASLPAYDLIAPVPLSRARLWRRGMNQSVVLAAEIPGVRDLRAIRRLGGGVAQVGAGRLARAAQVEGRFVADPRRVGGRRVLVVDDVVTTGATLGAVAGALLSAGAARVSAVTLLAAEARRC
ncbi:MAG: phosphoribosyltransferase family protein [Myxococcota bacterium]